MYFEDRGERRSLHAQATPLRTWTQGGAAAEGPAEAEQEAPGLPQCPEWERNLVKFPQAWSSGEA